MTIHVGDKVRFLPIGFHTCRLPARAAARPLPLISPTGQKVAGAQRRRRQRRSGSTARTQVGFNPRSAAGHCSARSVTYNGSKRVESAACRCADKPKPMTVKFTKTGTYTYYCDIHAGHEGHGHGRQARASRSRPRRPTSRRSSSRSRRDLKTAKKLAATTPPAGTVDVGASGKPGGVEYFGFVPEHAHRPGRARR